MSKNDVRSKQRATLRERATHDPDETIPEDIQDQFDFDTTISSMSHNHALGHTADLLPAGGQIRYEPPGASTKPLESVCPTCGQIYRDGEKFCGVDGSAVRPITSRRNLLESGGFGTILAGRYLLGRTIAQSQNAIVVEARQVHLGREVAIKFLNPQVVTDGSASQMLRREAAQTAALTHRHIVEVVDFGIDHGELPYLAMERLAGEALTERLSRTPMASRDVIEMGKQICQALHCIHQQGIIHRDLKPSNVWLQNTSNTGVDVKLLDFGLCKVLPNGRKAIPQGSKERIVGTPNYMSPEQTRGENIDQRTDLYSLGCILWEALTGRPFVRGRTTLDVMRQHGGGEVQPPSNYALDVHPGLEITILKALEKDRDRRWVDGSSMYEALCGHV